MAQSEAQIVKGAVGELPAMSQEERARNVNEVQQQLDNPRLTDVARSALTDYMKTLQSGKQFGTAQSAATQMPQITQEQLAQLESGSVPSQMVTAAPTQTGGVNVGMGALEALGAQLQNAYKQGISTLESTKNDAALVATTKELAGATARKNALDFATTIGANPGANSFALPGLVSRSQELYERQREIATHLENAGNPRTLFSKPLTWLSDYLLTPFNQQRMQAVSSQLASTNQQIKWINDTTQETRQTQDAISLAQTTGTAHAAANLAMAGITTEQQKLQVDALKANSSNLMATQRMKMDEQSMKLRERDQELQEQGLAIQRANQAANSQLLLMKLADAKTAAEAGNSLLNRYNLGAQNTGTQQFKSVDEFDAARRMGLIDNQTLAINYNNGSAQLAGVTPTIASTPAAALEFYATKRPQLDPGREQLMRKLSGTFKDLQQDMNAKALMTNPRTGKASTEGVNTQIARKLSEYEKNITKNTDDNPYAAPPMATLLADEGIAATYLGSKILAPLERNGDKEVPFTKAILLLGDAVTTGKISEQQASTELGYLAAKIKFTNNDLYRYSATAGVPNMKRVMVPVEVPQPKGFTYYAMAANPATVGAANMVQQLNTKTQLLDISDPVVRADLFNKLRAASLPISVPAGKTD